MKSAPSAAATCAFVHVARQPILTAESTLYGYELLFRSGLTEGSGLDAPQGSDDRWRPSVDEDAATTTTILSAFSEFGSHLLGGRLGFVNLTRRFVTGHLPIPFEPAAGVLEVLESITIDDEVIAGCRARVDEGHRLALDDFVWSPSALPLVRLASIVKVDVLNTPWDQVEETVARCAPHGVRLLAEKVEDTATTDRCRSLGFTLFQGYHLGRPQTLSMESLGPGKAVALQLLARLAEIDTSPTDVEKVLRTDPAMSIRLLRIVNSAHHSLSRRIGSIRDAVVLIGMARLRAWMVLLSLSSARPAEQEHLVTALIRARTCELSAQRLQPGVRADAAFTVGLLHGIAEALGMPMSEFVRGLPALGDELRAPLMGDDGPLRELLDAVLGYEQRSPQASLRHDFAQVAQAYTEALAWTSATVATAGRV